MPSFLKYVRFPDFYYICGCLDHNEKDCDRELELKHEGKEVYRGYGDWLRAEMYTPPNSNKGPLAQRSPNASPNRSYSNEESSSRFQTNYSPPATAGAAAATKAQPVLTTSPSPCSGQRVTNGGILGIAPQSTGSEDNFAGESTNPVVNQISKLVGSTEEIGDKESNILT